MSNLSAKEKAKELVGIFGKELAIKAVDEIMKAFPDCELTDVPIEDFEYWLEVKKEIENYGI